MHQVNTRRTHALQVTPLGHTHCSGEKKEKTGQQREGRQKKKKRETNGDVEPSRSTKVRRRCPAIIVPVVKKSGQERLDYNLVRSNSAFGATRESRNLDVHTNWLRLFYLRLFICSCSLLDQARDANYTRLAILLINLALFLFKRANKGTSTIVNV